MQTSMRFLALQVAVLGLILPGPAQAYIGPGAGLGAIAVAVALILGLLLLVIGLVWYPLKRFFRSRANGGTTGAGKTDKPG
jgi:TM2 domain-containing membrane protein YozV